MFIIPLVAWEGCKLLALEGLAVQVSIFEAAMPPMVSAGALAIIAGLAPELVSALIAVGIFLSFITLPLFYQLLM
ncbi:MAG: malate permease [Desulfonauticus sp.]|nr:malate permease [Desulfonauticus sp.]